MHAAWPDQERQQSEEGMVRREYPEAPVAAVGVIIRQGDRIALVRRDKEPSKGLWTFPGGAIELGESLGDAARREALEETGLDVKVGEVATVIDNIVRDETGRIRYHYVIVDYHACPLGGTLRAGTDVSDACWASLADLDGLQMTDKAESLARKLLADLKS
jgi:8-oxo-dGTP diphosphatase